MILDIGSLMFNMHVSKGATPSWGTEMGQGEGYKFSFEDSENLITSLVYNCVDDMENVNCEFGKGGSRTADFRIVLASLYKKVFVNDIVIPNAKFLIIVAKQINNPTGNHIGRKTLKYSPNMTYCGEKINEQCFTMIREALGLNEKSAWFINEITTKNQDELHLSVYICDKDKELMFEDTKTRKEFVKNKIEEGKPKIRIIGGNNKIYYGVPGTGKSFSIDKELKEIKDENKFRVTFHPEYTYSDFIGQLVPTIKKNSENKDEITYSFKKGIFTEALEKAYSTPKEAIYLIIEEMSRGNCAAIFGDIFQLLDRIKDEDEKDWSIYSVDNEMIAQNIQEITGNKIRIPSNMYILGTINTSDQNVYVMDNAFKRRFDWEYISTRPVKEDNVYLNNAEIILNNGEENININWIDLYGVLNKFISSPERLGLGEDKQIGQFFINFDNDTNKNKDKVKNKLLQYLWFDIQETAYKTEHKLFDEKIKCFSDIYESFEQDKKIFSDEFFECIELWKNNNL